MNNSKAILSRNVPMLIVVMALVAMSLWQSILPASWWMEVTKVEIDDGTTADGCLPMDVDRTFHRDFHATWLVTIMRETSNGQFATYLTYPRGENDYQISNDLPDDLTLCWWTFTKNLGVPFADHQIFLPAGTYRVHTLWTLNVAGGDREIRRKSNRFTITAD